MTILDEIMAHKRAEVEQRRRRRSEADLRVSAEAMPPARGFVKALQHAASKGSAVIAEVKKASPSKGLIRSDFEPAAIAASYQTSGAACLSVLTDEKYFQGHDNDLVEARAACSLPVLRKEFITDQYQLFEARALGADCVLLIAAAFDIMQLTVLHGTARGLGLDVLIEVHDRVELQAALSLNPAMIGINNRDLKTFETRLDTTLSLCREIPDGVLVVTESGIHTRDDVKRLANAGIRAYLVGEAFMRAEDPGAELRRLFF